MDRDIEFEEGTAEGQPADGERQPSLPKDDNKRFFTLVTDIRKTLAEIESKIGSQMGSAGNEGSLAAILQELDNPFEKEKVGTKVEQKCTEIQDLVKHAQRQLQEVENDAKDTNKEYSVADRKMRTNMHTTLLKRTEDLIDRFVALKSKNREKNEEDVKRHVKIVLADKDADPDGPFVDKEGREYTEEELDDLAAQCLETGTNPFAAGLAQTALEDVLRKHAEIVKIERSIEEVAELFNDLAILVTAQGEVLDNIEDHVTAAYKDVNKGLKELVKARENSVKNRKRMCCLWWCLVVALVVTLFPLLSSSLWAA